MLKAILSQTNCIMLSYWEQAHRNQPFDVIVIGSGITGSSAAINLKKQSPKLRVAIVEAEKLFMTTASTKNAGFACFGSLSELLEDEALLGTDAMLDLVKRRWKGLNTLKSLIPVAAMDFIPCGGHEVFEDQELFQKCWAERERMNALLLPIIGPEVFSEKENPQDFGFKGFHTSIGNSYESQLDPAKMMDAFHSKLRAMDVPIYMASRVERIEEEKESVKLHLDEGILYARHVLVATNGLSKKLLDLDVRATRAQVLITEPIPDLKWKGVFHLDLGYTYFRNVGNRILLGGRRNLDIEAEYTDEMTVSPVIQESLETLLREKILPNSNISIAQRWVGIMGTGSARNPILQSCSERIHCAVRLGGMGLAIGSSLGADAASLILSRI